MAPAWFVRAADGDEALLAKALALNDTTGSDPIKGQIKALLKDADGTKKLLVVAGRAAKGKNQPFSYNAAYILGSAARELKDADHTKVFYRICIDQAVKLQSGQKLVESFGGLVESLYDQKKFDEVVELCKEFVELDSDNDEVKRRKLDMMEIMIRAYARQGKTDEALKLVNNLVKLEDKTGGWYYLQLKASVLHEASRDDESVKAFETVLDRIDKDKGLEKKEKDRYLQRVRYMLSSVYVDLKQIDKAAEYLQTLLKDVPDDPTYNNDLGYIWADNDKNLDQAEKLIRKALEADRKKRKLDPEYDPKEDKDNAAYLDSMGWVLFKQKKYEEAKKYLSAAVQEKEGQHIEIFDHLGDVLMALNDKEGAIIAWKKGLESAGTTKRELERKALVEKKLKGVK